MQEKTYITNPIEIAAHIETLVHRRIRADIKILGDGDIVRVIFLGHGGTGEDSHVLLERLVPLGASDRLDIGKDVHVEYLEDGVAFYFESRSIDIEDSDGCIRLGFPARVVKSQRRRFFRIAPSPPPPVFDVVVDTGSISSKGLVKDISAGGLAFLTTLDSDYLRPGMEVGLGFSLPDGYAVNARGIIRSHVPTNESAPNRKYRCGVEFVRIPESVQDRIVAYVFNRQKEEIRRHRE
jgi:c-di-GMP-binding flagellar brake protein YcgR